MLPLAHHMNMMFDRFIMCPLCHSVTLLRQKLVHLLVWCMAVPLHICTRIYRLYITAVLMCLSLLQSPEADFTAVSHQNQSTLNITSQKCSARASTLTALHTHQISDYKPGKNIFHLPWLPSGYTDALRCLQLATSNQKSTYICVYMKSD